MRMAFQPERIEQVAKALTLAPEVVSNELFSAVTEIDLLLEREAKERAPRAQGTLSNSIFSEETRLDNGAIGIVSSSLAYAEPVELGTRPHRPPVEPLALWVKTKLGITDERRSKQVAYAIANKIARHGTEGAFFFRNALDDNRDQAQRIFDQAIDRIIARVEGA